MTVRAVDQYFNLVHTVDDGQIELSSSGGALDLVDPDNRVEPDWDERRALVDRARALDGPTAWSGDDDEATKAVLIERILRLRRRRPAAFGMEAGYEPVGFTGRHADRVLGFARSRCSARHGHRHSSQTAGSPPRTG